jgi:hypothetical protein
VGKTCESHSKPRGEAPMCDSVTVTVKNYLFQQHIIKENEQPILSPFLPDSQRRPNRGRWYQRPGAPLMVHKTSFHPGLTLNQLDRH